MGLGTVVVLSGGIDSAVVLYMLLKHGKGFGRRRPFRALGIDYGQRHRKELYAAAEIAVHAGVEYKIADASALSPLFGTHCLTGVGEPMPKGHFKDESMKATIVPNRNMLLIAIACTYAAGLGFDTVAVGVQDSANSIYPDSRMEFIQGMDRAAREGNVNPITIAAPLINSTKPEIIQLGAGLGVPLRATWSCYEGGRVHCGQCGACSKRKDGFRESRVSDPTEYAR